MSLKEKVYSVLVVSASEPFNLSLTTLLPESTYHPIRFASNIGAARRILSERSVDFVIVNAPLPDDMGTNFAIDLSTTKGTIVLLLAKSDIHTSVNEKVAGYGVFTLSKPIAKQTLLQAFSWMISARERIRQFEQKTLTLDEKMAEIRLVNRAKWMLISELKMTEPEAHHYIEKQAMDSCVTKKIIAENIIKTYS